MVVAPHRPMVRRPGLDEEVAAKLPELSEELGGGGASDPFTKRSPIQVTSTCAPQHLELLFLPQGHTRALTRTM